MRRNQILLEKTYQFALDVIGLYKAMLEQNEYIISKQIVRSGTSIGANVEEAIAAQSRKDFISKMSIASKEARETNYWLRLINEAEITNSKETDELLKISMSLIKLLSSITYSAKKNLLSSK